MIRWDYVLVGCANHLIAKRWEQCVLTSFLKNSRNCNLIVQLTNLKVYSLLYFSEAQLEWICPGLYKLIKLWNVK